MNKFRQTSSRMEKTKTGSLLSVFPKLGSELVKDLNVNNILYEVKQKKSCRGISMWPRCEEGLLKQNFQSASHSQKKSLHQS